MKHKLNNKGETYIETLFALLILALVITGFAEVVATTAKVNIRIRDYRVALSKPSEAKPTTRNWTVGLYAKDGLTKIADYTTQVYCDEKSGLYYYE